MSAVTIQAVIFDFNGVLTADESGSLTTNRYLSSRSGIAESALHAAFPPFNGDLLCGRTTHAAIWFVLCKRLHQDLDIGLLDGAFASTTKNQPMLDLARVLRTRYRTAIITDNHAVRMDNLTRAWRLDEVFAPIVVSSHFGDTKRGCLYWR